MLPATRVIIRGLRNRPGFSALVVLTMALGIGINVAIFSALQAVVLNPLPFPNADRLVAVYEDASWIGYSKNTPSPANFFDWKREAKSFEDMAATSGCRAVLTGDGAPEELRAIQARLNKLHPRDGDPRLGAAVEPLRDALVGKTRAALWILMGAAGLVLVIACANVANLLLARATGRQREMAVRSALGAAATDLLAQVFMETLLLTVAGGAAGVIMAVAARNLLENFIPQALKGAVAITLDLRVLGFALLAGLAAAILAAMSPILHVLRTPLIDLLREDARTGSSRATMRLRGMLVAGEVALTVALLAGAGLMVRSLMAIWNTDLGFRPEKLMTVRVSLPAKYGDSQKAWQFYDRALEKIRAIPAVTAADFVSTAPFFSIGNSRGFAIEGRTPGGQFEKSDMLTRAATPAYLQTIGAALLAGRSFYEADRDDAPEVAIVNETFARVFFPNASPLGHRMSLTDGKANQRRWRIIVGVVKNINERGYDYDPKPVTYIPVRQSDYTLTQLVVRTTQAAPAGLVNALRVAIQQVDPDQPIGQARTFDEVLAQDQASRRQQMFLLALFAALSLVLACLGIYAVLSYMVELRRQEVGVRLALGARSGDVIRMIAADGMKLAGAGMAAGLALTLAGARLLAASLYGVKPFDPITLAVVCAVLCVVALVACLIPARRAAATSPSTVLKG